MSMRAVCEIVFGCIVGLAIGGAVLYGVVELAGLIVEHSHESHSYSIPNRGQACWANGEAPAVVPASVSLALAKAADEAEAKLPK